MRTLINALILIVLISGPCWAQSYEIEYEYPGEAVYTWLYGEHFRTPDNYDLDGDGRAEIVIRDATGWPDSIRTVVVDGITHGQMWSYIRGGGEYGFAGFVDLDGDSVREALIADNGVLEVVEVPSGTTVATIPAGYSGDIVAYDFDADGRPELLIRSSTGVQIWGWNPGPEVGVPTIVQRGTTLAQNHPNPFNPRTAISYQVQSSGAVRLDVLDLRGRLVRTLVSEVQQAGEHEAVWDGTDDRGRRQASGSYLYVLQVGEFTASRKLLLLK